MRLVWLFALVACGNDVAPVDPPADTTVPPDTLVTPGCDWTEQNDPLNDPTLGNGVVEDTHLSLQTQLAICGSVDTGHLISGVVDVDAYLFALTDRTQLRVDFAGDASALASLDVTLIDDGNVVVERGHYLGTHIAFVTTLSAGSYRLDVTATNPTDVAPFDYTLHVIANPPACARATTASYTEAADGPQSDRNDVIEIRYATNERVLTAANNDDPEPTGLTLAADVLITGLSGDVDGADDFKDRDTYLFDTGANDELAIRVDWTGDADLDVFVFPENTVAEIGRGTTVGKTGPETAVFPVLANTRYWLWVGSYDSSAGLPVNYDVTLCPSTF